MRCCSGYVGYGTRTDHWTSAAQQALLCGLELRAASDRPLAVLGDGNVVDLLVTDVQLPGRRAQALRPTLAVLYCTVHAEMIGEEGPALGSILAPYP